MSRAPTGYTLLPHKKQYWVKVLTFVRLLIVLMSSRTSYFVYKVRLTSNFSVYVLPTLANMVFPVPGGPCIKIFLYIPLFFLVFLVAIATSL